MAKDTQPKEVVSTQTNYTDFLKKNKLLFDRVQAGIELHLNDETLNVFQNIAKTINKDLNFQIHGCQECVQSLVLYVFQNYK